MGFISFWFRLVTLVSVGLVILPLGLQAVRLNRAAEDPARLAMLTAGPLITAPRVAQEIDAALAAGDADLALSFVALADRRGVTVEPSRRAAVAAANEPSLTRSAGEFASGAVIGDVNSLTGLAGAFTGDMVGIGDIRDLTREGWKAAKGEEPDRLIVGLAAIGLAATAATWVSVGEASPVRAGLTLFKGARRSGRLSAGLTRFIGRQIAAAVDFALLKRAMREMGSLRLAEARRLTIAAVRTDRLAPLASLATDSARIYRRTDLRGVMDTLAIAGNAREVAKVARLSERLGKATRATLKLAGRGIFALLSGALTLLFWIGALIVWLFAIGRSCTRLGTRLGRIRLRRRRPAAVYISPQALSRTSSRRPATAFRPKPA